MRTFLIAAIAMISWTSALHTRGQGTHDAQMAVDLNRAIFEMARAEDGFATLKGLRTAAMAHIAMHDVLNAFDRRFAPYCFYDLNADIDAVSAAAAAARLVVATSYPDRIDRIDQVLNTWLPQTQDSDEAVFGQEVAGTIIARRENDGWNGSAEYMWQPMAPGVYAEFNKHSGTPEGFIFGAGWAEAKPFMLPFHLKSPPPPEIGSRAYAEAFDEVKAWGSDKSTLRTDDQTHLAMWWKDFVENSHNRLARELVVKEELDLWEATRTFALLNMAIFDAYVNVFANKFEYNHWRPYTAIRWAEHDGNRHTAPDTAWNNLHHHTYPFPSYPSAHGTASSAAMTVLAYTLGTGDTYAFTMRTDSVESRGIGSEMKAMDPPTRAFERFSEAGLEASMSRVYLGIHFRYDSEEGHRLGNAIGKYAADNYLKAM